MESYNSKILTKTIAQAKKGKDKALHSLYDQFSKAMFNVCLRMCDSREDAEDVLQEAFTAAFKNLHTYSHEATFGAWLKRIVVNRCINSLSIKTGNGVLSDVELPVMDDESIDFSTIEMKVEQVNRAIMALPDGYRVITTLYLLEGYDHVEISEIMGITVSTSKSQYMRAKRRIREALKNEKLRVTN